MEEITLYHVRVPADCEGHSTKIVASFKSLNEAKNFAISDAGRDAWKQEGRVNAEVIKVYESAEEAGATTMEAVKKSALLKLTDVEKIALGLMEPKN